jgi:multidrug resistance efflux pump
MTASLPRKGFGRSKRAHSKHVHRRGGNTITFSLGAIAIVAGLSFAGWWMFGTGSGEEDLELITNVVSKGPYDFVVIEQGTVESAKNVELRCEVRARGGGGGESSRGSSGMGGGSVSIIDVIPEGTMVQGPLLDENGKLVLDENGKPVREGEIVVQLDSSALELEAETQQTKVNVQKAQVVQSRNMLTAAEIARTEYLEGTFVSQEKETLSQLFFAQQQLKTASMNLDSAKNLMAKGIATALQVEAAQFAVDDASKKYEVQQTRLKTLQEYTKAKELTKFDSDIDTARQKVILEENSLQVEEKKLSDIKSQVGKCTIRAPSAGQVVYANQYDSFRGSSQAEFIVTPGAMVRERQVLIRLPDAADMQVRATVNEARVTLVRAGLPVTIRVDALKDEVIHGEVVRVNQYAEAGGFSSGNIKRYATIIKVFDAPPGLRVGMNAEVRIHVERKQEALQVPVQALAEYKGHFFSLVQEGDEFKTREVKLSSTNDKVATIESGLTDGDVVVMNPRSAGGMLVLPDLPDPAPAHITKDIVRAQPGPVTLAAVNPGGVGGAPPAAEGGRGEGAEGGGGGAKGEKGKGKKGGGFTPAAMVDRYLESDADKDGKLSKDEVNSMDDRRKEALASADVDGDGFLSRTELMAAASSAMQRMREKGGGGGGGGGGFGGRGRGEGGGGPPGQNGPAGGGE